ncbi:hypothetical protein SUDANB95_05474 [Actinosynnema sp. ALI-1.44]
MFPPPPDPVIDAHVAQLVADAPPLSEETCQLLSVLMRPDLVAEDHAAA